jgi:hypothetical protein
MAHIPMNSMKASEKDKAIVRYYQKIGKEPKSERAKQAFKNVSASSWSPGIRLSKADADAHRAKRREWDRAYKARKAMQKNGQAQSQFMPAMHDRCPKCGARFYYVADQQQTNDS